MTNSSTAAPAGDGLFSRLVELTDILLKLPDQLSDHELEGLVGLLPPDTARAIGAVFVPRVREVSLPFLKLLGAWIQRVQRAKEEGKKVILIPFNFPPEVIRVFRGAEPLTCEVLTTLAVATLEGQGERYWDHAMALGIPDFLCSSSTVALGSILSGRDLQPDGIVQATAGACDANSKIHEFAARFLGVPQFFVEKPAASGQRGRAQHRRYFRRFMQELGEFIGEELDEDRMREVMTQVDRAGTLYNDLQDLRRLAPCPVPNLLTLYCYATRFSSWGTEEAVEVMRKMVELSTRRMQAGAYPADKEVARCLWLYTGYYFDLYGLFNWMEEQGISYLDDALALSSHPPVDLTSKESMLLHLAGTVWDYPMTRQMGATSMSATWMEDMVAVTRDLGATMAIFSGHHACKQTWSVFAKVREELTRRTGVPVLCLQGDSWSRRITPIGSLQQEISAFVDTVVLPRQGRKRRRRRRTSAPSEPR